MHNHDRHHHHHNNESCIGAHWCFASCCKGWRRMIRLDTRHCTLQSGPLVMHYAVWIYVNHYDISCWLKMVGSLDRGSPFRQSRKHARTSLIENLFHLTTCDVHCVILTTSVPGQNLNALSKVRMYQRRRTCTSPVASPTGPWGVGLVTNTGL